MIAGIDAQDLRKVLAFTAGRIEDAEAQLNALDAAVGDGDHGITMRVGFNAVRSTVVAMPPDASISEVFNTAGKAFMSATGGAIGVILGSMIVAGGKALTDVTLIGPSELMTMLNAMEAAVVKVGKAHPGDKTILDSVHAACQSLNSSSIDNSLQSALSCAADAAKTGAEGTSKMLCSVGRASRLGVRVLGHPDPGAVSFSLIMGSMAEWVRTGSAI